MSFFSCLVDCAGFDLIYDCSGLLHDRNAENQRNTNVSSTREGPKQELELEEGSLSPDSIEGSFGSGSANNAGRKAAVSPSTCPIPSWSSSDNHKAFPEDHVPHVRSSGVSLDGNRDHVGVGAVEQEKRINAGYHLGENSSERSSSEATHRASTPSESSTTSSTLPHYDETTTEQTAPLTTNGSKPLSSIAPRDEATTATGAGDYSPVRRSSLPTLRSIVRSRSDGVRSIRRPGAPSTGARKSVSDPALLSSSPGGSRRQRGSSQKSFSSRDGNDSYNNRVLREEDDESDLSLDDEDFGDAGVQPAPAIDEPTTGAGQPKRPPLRYRSASMETAKSYGDVNNEDDADSDDYDEEQQYLDVVSGVAGGKSPGRKLKRVNSAPSADEMRAAATPGRERERDGAGEMARRVVAKWGEEDDDDPFSSPETSPRRRQILTSVRHLRLSEDGSTVTVKSEKDGGDYNLALSELQEIHGTPSKNRVVLRGKKLELRIAFEGQKQAFKQFRDTLVPIVNINNKLRNDRPPTTPKLPVNNNRSKIPLPLPVPPTYNEDEEAPKTPKGALTMSGIAARQFRSPSPTNSNALANSPRALAPSPGSSYDAGFITPGTSTAGRTKSRGAKNSRASDVVGVSTTTQPSFGGSSNPYRAGKHVPEEHSRTMREVNVRSNGRVLDRAVPATSSTTVHAENCGSSAVTTQASTKDAAPSPASAYGLPSSFATREGGSAREKSSSTETARKYRQTLSFASVNAPTSPRPSTLGSRFSAPSPASVQLSVDYSSRAGPEDDTDNDEAVHDSTPRYSLGMAADSLGSSTSSLGGVSNISDAMSHASNAFAVNNTRFSQGLGIAAGHAYRQPERRPSPTTVARRSMGRSQLPASAEPESGMDYDKSRRTQRTQSWHSGVAESNKTSSTTTTSVASEIAKRNALALGVARRNASATDSVVSGRTPYRHSHDPQLERAPRGSVSSARQMFESRSNKLVSAPPVPPRATPPSYSASFSHMTGNAGKRNESDERAFQGVNGADGGVPDGQGTRKGGFVAEQRRKIDFNESASNGNGPKGGSSGMEEDAGYSAAGYSYLRRDDSNCDGGEAANAVKYDIRSTKENEKRGTEARAAPRSGHPRNEQTPTVLAQEQASGEIVSPVVPRSDHIFSYSTPVSKRDKSTQSLDQYNAYRNNDNNNNISNTSNYDKNKTSGGVRLGDGRAPALENSDRSREKAKQMVHDSSSSSSTFVFGEGHNAGTTEKPASSRVQGRMTPPLPKTRRSAAFSKQTPNSSFMDEPARGSNSEDGGSRVGGAGTTKARPAVLKSRRSKVFSTQTPNSSFMDEGEATNERVRENSPGGVCGSSQRGSPEFISPGRNTWAPASGGTPPVHSNSRRPILFGKQTPPGSFMDNICGNSGGLAGKLNDKGGSVVTGTHRNVSVGFGGADTPPVHRSVGSKPLSKQTPHGSFMEDAGVWKESKKISSAAGAVDGKGGIATAMPATSRIPASTASGGKRSKTSAISSIDSFDGRKTVNAGGIQTHDHPRDIGKRGAEGTQDAGITSSQIGSVTTRAYEARVPVSACSVTIGDPTGRHGRFIINPWNHWQNLRKGTYFASQAQKRAEYDQWKAREWEGIKAEHYRTSLR